MNQARLCTPSTSDAAYQTIGIGLVFPFPEKSVSLAVRAIFSKIMSTGDGGKTIQLARVPHSGTCSTLEIEVNFVDNIEAVTGWANNGACPAP